MCDEQAYKNNDRLVIGGDSPVDAIYIAIRAETELVPDAKLFINVHPLFQLSDPVPGVKTTVAAIMNTGGAPGPASTDPVVNSANPATAQEAILAPAIAIRGSNFQDGATVEIIGDTAVAVAGVIFNSETELSVGITISAEAAFPAPNSYDVLVINPDGSNGVGVGLITSYA